MADRLLPGGARSQYRSVATDSPSEVDSPSLAPPARPPRAVAPPPPSRPPPYGARRQPLRCIVPCGPRTPGAPPSALPWHAEAMQWSGWGPAGSPLEQAQAARRRAAILCVLCAMQCDTRVIPGYSGYDSGYTRVFGWAAFWTHFWLYEGKKLELRAAARPDLELRLSADPLPDRPASGRSLM